MTKKIHLGESPNEVFTVPEGHSPHTNTSVTLITIGHFAIIKLLRHSLGSGSFPVIFYISEN